MFLWNVWIVLNHYLEENTSLIGYFEFAGLKLKEKSRWVIVQSKYDLFGHFPRRIPLLLNITKRHYFMKWHIIFRSYFESDRFESDRLESDRFRFLPVDWTLLKRLTLLKIWPKHNNKSFQKITSSKWRISQYTNTLEWKGHQCQFDDFE